MTNKSALVTVAMLSAFLSKEKKDYLDLIAPFVLSLLPNKRGEKIEVSQILEQLKVNYGFEDMPSHVLKKILLRNAKGSIGIVEKRKENRDYEFYVKDIFDSTKFEEKRLKMKELTEDIIEALFNYLKNINSLKNITLDESHKRLVAFLNYYGYTVIKNIDELRSVTIKNDQNNYYIARFILEEYEKDSTVFSKILELVKGFLVYKAIYFFSSEQKKSIDSRLKGTKIYLDTRLLIYALGYNREEDKIATRELIRLVYENGGEVKTFIHNKDEVAGILTKYAKDRDSRNSLSLEYFNISCYDEADVIRLRDSLTLNLERNSIKIEDIPEYGIVSSEGLIDKGYLDLNELRAKLEENINYNSKNSKGNALDNDVDSISAISRIRGKARPCSIEDCRAIFVTTNTPLVRTLFDLYYKERFSKGEICFAINDIDLTAILWLKSFDKKTDLPCLKLMECVYAACSPSDEVMEAFIEKVIQLEKEGAISSEVALIMRSQNAVKNDVLELSENDSSRISVEMVKNVEKRLIERIRQEDEAQINALKKENEEYKKRESQAYLNAENEAKDESRKYRRFLDLLVKFVFAILFTIGISGFVVSFITTISSYLIVGILVTIISILGFLDLLISYFGVMRKWIDGRTKKKFDKIYAKKIEQLNKFFSLNIY